MQVHSVQDNLNFCGKVIVVGKNSRKTLKNIAREINEMKIVKNSERNIFIGEYCMESLLGRNFRKVYNMNCPNRQVVVLASGKNSKDKNLATDMYFKGISTVKNSQALISATKRAIQKSEPENTEKVVQKNLFQKIKDFVCSKIRLDKKELN